MPTVSVIVISFPAVPALAAARLAYDSVLVTPAYAVSPLIPTVEPFVMPEPNFTFEVSEVPLMASFKFVILLRSLPVRCQ